MKFILCLQYYHMFSFVNSYKNTQRHSCWIYSQCFLSWASQQHDLIFITCWIRQKVLRLFHCCIIAFFHLPSMNLAMDNIDHNLCSIHVEWNRVVLKAIKSKWIKSEMIFDLIAFWHSQIYLRCGCCLTGVKVKQTTKINKSMIIAA
jgi:hypothetical protein